jgi:hypothetical protein
MGGKKTEAQTKCGNAKETLKLFQRKRFAMTDEIPTETREENAAKIKETEERIGELKAQMEEELDQRQADRVNVHTIAVAEDVKAHTTKAMDASVADIKDDAKENRIIIVEAFEKSKTPALDPDADFETQIAHARNAINNLKDQKRDNAIAKKKAKADAKAAEKAASDAQAAANVAAGGKGPSPLEGPKPKKAKTGLQIFQNDITVEISASMKSFGQKTFLKQASLMWGALKALGGQRPYYDKAMCVKAMDGPTDDASTSASSNGPFECAAEEEGAEEEGTQDLKGNAH